MKKYNHKASELHEAMGITKEEFDVLLDIHKEFVETNEPNCASEMLEFIENKIEDLNNRKTALLVFFGAMFHRNFKQRAIAVPFPPERLLRKLAEGKMSKKITSTKERKDDPMYG